MNNAATATARTYSALFLALAMVLPFLTGQIPEIGSMLCPMHIPALLCGFMCGWPWGLAVGFISPLLRSMSGMPPIWIAIPMAFEMATYGAIAGLLYRKLPLISAMVAGRLVWGLVKFLLAGLQGTEFSLALFLSGAVTTAIPGIILQLILIPILVAVMERTNMALDV
jgi:thiamine transporter ThiT